MSSMIFTVTVVSLLVANVGAEQASCNTTDDPDDEVAFLQFPRQARANGVGAALFTTPPPTATQRQKLIDSINRNFNCANDPHQKKGCFHNVLKDNHLCTCSHVVDQLDCHWIPGCTWNNSSCSGSCHQCLAIAHEHACVTSSCCWMQHGVDACYPPAMFGMQKCEH
eukprot:gnl/TRDRNA2_/TRDRNA2_37273_c0_seq1.p1 gnl/TRDRNA2_/TRDRNA2_37273_c0~~gnl/TRDRNA2_/TRDRNA2_37273_c0_seq1.p1  ORF type:complete len:187 (-),score=15.22 gnl/TRDRNA2_/TRDRNA2_37273_c0_seq1:9-509(-)